MEPSVWGRYWHALLCDGRPGCEEAVRLMSEVLEQDPTQRTARVHRGKALALLTQPDAAAADFRCVLEQDPQNWEARVNLAALYILLGLYDEAEQHLRRALACDLEWQRREDRQMIPPEPP